jgi:hypothetical protein
MESWLPSTDPIELIDTRLFSWQPRHHNYLYQCLITRVPWSHRIIARLIRLGDQLPPLLLALRYPPLTEIPSAQLP